jgi:hypothetical protein
VANGAMAQGWEGSAVSMAKYAFHTLVVVRANSASAMVILGNVGVYCSHCSMTRPRVFMRHLLLAVALMSIAVLRQAMVSGYIDVGTPLVSGQAVTFENRTSARSWSVTDRIKSAFMDKSINSSEYLL